MNGKTCGEECKKGCGSEGGACCSIGSCDGCGCGCGHKAVHIIAKIVLVILIFWAGMQFGGYKALRGNARYGAMMQDRPMMQVQGGMMGR